MSTVRPFPNPPPTAARPASAAALPEALQLKAVAVRLQLDAYERELALAQANARVALLEREKLTEQLPQLEQQFLAALNAPQGAKFNWQTFTYDESLHDIPETSPAGSSAGAPAHQEIADGPPAYDQSDAAPRPGR